VWTPDQRRTVPLRSTLRRIRGTPFGRGISNDLQAHRLFRLDIFVSDNSHAALHHLPRAVFL